MTSLGEIMEDPPEVWKETVRCIIKFHNKIGARHEALWLQYLEQVFVAEKDPWTDEEIRKLYKAFVCVLEGVKRLEFTRSA
jgi:hypothetical protein